MTLIANNTTIPTSATITAKGTNLTKVVANGVTVWQKVVFTYKDFPYNGTDGTDGSVQEWEVPVTGTYQLEVYGAEGGSLSHFGNGAAGGYSIGTKYLTAGTKLYICVGGKGTNGNYGGVDNIKGGYNGGGNGQRENHDLAFSGGGCTSICINTNRGELKNYNSFRSEVLIVAGGGGGASMGGRDIDSNSDITIGGVGGGLIGASGINDGGNGGTQTEAGDWRGGFGFGGSDINGGGGGWYGGGTGNNDGEEWDDNDEEWKRIANPAGGGSGYINGVDNGQSFPGQRVGHGFAKITYIG